MPQVQNEAYGALVLSTHAYAKIISVDPSSALGMDGVYTYVSHTDLPSPEANYWGTEVIDEVFFAVNEVVAYGQPIGMVVAQTKIIAQKAARLVKVTYESLGTPILSLEQAVEKSSFFTEYNRRIARGEEIKGAIQNSECVLEGTTRVGGQEVRISCLEASIRYQIDVAYYSTSIWRPWQLWRELFLLSICVLILTGLNRVPKHESGEMEVFSSTQSLTDCQQWAAQASYILTGACLSSDFRRTGYRRSSKSHCCEK